MIPDIPGQAGTTIDGRVRTGRERLSVDGAPWRALLSVMLENISLIGMIVAVGLLVD